MTEIKVTQIAAGYDVPFPPCIRVSDLARAIAARAYEIFEERGCQHGCALDDWVQAEREMLGHARANLFEDDTGFAVDFRLPGFQPEHIDVAVSAQQVGMHARRVAASPDAVDVLHEFSEGEAYRQLFFPSAVDPETAAARVEDGVLHLTVKKAIAAAPEKSKPTSKRKGASA